MSKEYIINIDQAKQAIAWKKEGCSFRKVAEKFSDTYKVDFRGQENGIHLVKESLITIGRHPEECWNL